MMIEEPQKQSIKCQTKKEAQKKEKPDIKEPQNKTTQLLNKKRGGGRGKPKEATEWLTKRHNRRVKRVAR